MTRLLKWLKQLWSEQEYVPAEGEIPFDEWRRHMQQARRLQQIEEDKE